MKNRFLARTSFGGGDQARARVWRTLTVQLAMGLLLSLGLVAPAAAKIFLVLSSGDHGHGTLRQAVLDANAARGPHAILFALRPGSTITLTSGQIVFNGPDVVLLGPGRSRLTISGNRHSRIFDMRAGSVTLSDMTLRDGLAYNAGTNFYDDDGNPTNFYDQTGGAIRVGAPRAPLAVDQTTRASAQMQARSLHPWPLPDLTLALLRVDLINNRADAADLSGGGAIYAEGGANLIVHDSQFIGNSTAYAGGAILTMGSADFLSPVAAGSIDIQGSSFIGNHIDQNGVETGQGAGMLTFGPGGSIRNSIFRDNVINDAPPAQEWSEGLGGALAILLVGKSSVSIDSTEISHNTIALRPDVYSEGAGFYCDGLDATPGAGTSVTVTNSTISGNQSENGAAIEAGCNLNLFNTTVADNVSPNTRSDVTGGGGDAIEMIYAEGKFNAQSTLIANPLARTDLFLWRGEVNLGTVSKSLVMKPDLPGPALPADTITGIDPLLAPLADNGGPTRTHALRVGSVAIDAGSNPQKLKFDQRGSGYSRTSGQATDIGAFERCTSRCGGGN